MDSFANRWKKAEEEMRRQGIDCMLLTPSSNMKYMTGYSLRADERLLTAVFSPGHEPFFIANALYELSLAEVPYRDILYWKDSEDPFALLSREIERRGIPMNTVAIDVLFCLCWACIRTANFLLPRASWPVCVFTRMRLKLSL